MKSAAALALLLLAALAVPTAQAQSVSGITVTATPLEQPIPYEGTAQMVVSATVGCAEILSAMSQNGGAAPITFTVPSPPAWLTVGESSGDLAAPDTAVQCAGGGSMTYNGQLPLTVSKDAPGVVDHTIEVVATVGSTASEPADAIFTVAYNINYTITSDATFPLTVDGESVSFNVTITQASNARSMVMIEKLATSAGIFSGIPAVAYDNEAGKPASATYKATFKAPPTPGWGNATATFTAFGHYLLLDGRASDFGPPCAGETLPACDAEGTLVTYSFVEGHGAHGDDGDGDENDAPAPAGLLLALGLVALAAFARRRV